ncbi:hypothetical protein U1Q18_052732 [Sarracenia purpurea var. burkii]
MDTEMSDEFELLSQVRESMSNAEPKNSKGNTKLVITCGKPREEMVRLRQGEGSTCGTVIENSNYGAKEDKPSKGAEELRVRVIQNKEKRLEWEKQAETQPVHVIGQTKKDDGQSHLQDTTFCMPGASESNMTLMIHKVGYRNVR